MNVALKTNLESVIELSEQMLSRAVAPYPDDQIACIEIIHKNATALNAAGLMQMSLEELARQSHDLRQNLTAIVGYSAVLNSPKLSNHAKLNAEQLEWLVRLHDYSRNMHWHLDGLIMFAAHTVNPRAYKAQDMGMLNLGGYLRAQLENHMCRQYVTDIHIPDDLPNVYANDTHTKLVIRGILSAALELSEQPEIQVSAYTMMKVVRAKISISHTAQAYPELIASMEVHEIQSADDKRSTQGMAFKLASVESQSLRELGLYVATRLALQQGGRVKMEKDGHSLVFTLTMPTMPPNGMLS